MTIKRPSDLAHVEAPTSFCVLGFGQEVHWTSLALMHALRNWGYLVTGMIPRADDARWSEGRWRSERVAQLQRASSFAFPASAVCALNRTLEPQVDVSPFDAEALVDSFRALATWADMVVVDALGNPDGSAGLNTRDVAQALGLPVIIACDDSQQGLESACGLVKSLRRRQLRVTGWVQYGIRPMACAAGVTCIAAIPSGDMQDPLRAARHVNTRSLLDVLLPAGRTAGPAPSANPRKTGGLAF